MGCFSFLCKISGEPVNSDSASGERCRLYLLVNGVVVEEMRGCYNSYGVVFNDDTNSDEQVNESLEWKYADWSGVCDLMHSADKSNGVAAVLERHFIDGYVPKTRSESDPNQGWGEYDNDGTLVKSFWQQFAEANSK